MTTRTFEKINDLFHCKLILENGQEFTIPLREDGYIFATGLCKAIGKKVNGWLRLKETKKLKKTLEDNLFRVTELEKQLNKTDFQKNGITKNSKELIEIYQGGNNIYNQGTWVHPDLGLNLAQWCCPSFSLQVSKWLRELIFTGNVEIEKEKTDGEINTNYQNIIKELYETKEKLENAENLLQKYDKNNIELSSKYNKVHLNHQYYLRRKELYKLRKGNSVYLIDMKLSYGDDLQTKRLKVGFSSNITDRVSSFRTSNPFCQVIAVMYTYNSEVIEKFMKTKYDNNLKPNNHEFISGIDIEELKESMIAFVKMLNCEYTLETDEELRKFNKHIIKEGEVEEIEDNKIINEKKRCGGLHHETEESRILPLNEFFKNKSNKDGYARLCKECYLIGVYGDRRKKRKIVTLPKFDTTSHKWCNLCESVKNQSDFYADKATKDGLNSNCKACKNHQKKIYKENKKAEKKEI